MRILCFGDSNTYGYDPRSFLGDRYPEDARWVDLLGVKLNCDAVNIGECGRCVPTRAYEIQNVLHILEHEPSDWILIMLGVNDLLQGSNAETIANRMEQFLSSLLSWRKKCILIAPPQLQNGAWIENSEILDEAVILANQYEKVAARHGILFIDAVKWPVELTFDGVHFSENGHRSFANHLCKALDMLILAT